MGEVIAGFGVIAITLGVIALLVLTILLPWSAYSAAHYAKACHAELQKIRSELGRSR